MSYRLSTLAERDLQRIWSYVADDISADRADRLIDAIVHGFELLAEHPRMGRLRPEFGAGVRSFVVENHVFTVVVDLEGTASMMAAYAISRASLVVAAGPTRPMSCVCTSKLLVASTSETSTALLCWRRLS
jgi:toxin ParE1/3/4